MKKLLLAAAVLVGAVTASHAGVHVDIGFRLPLPPPPFVISRPAPVYHRAYRPPVVVAPCPPPRVIYAPPYRHFRGRVHYGRPHQGWNSHGHRHGRDHGRYHRGHRH